jgi:regulator-associated protein of mTOR
MISQIEWDGDIDFTLDAGAHAESNRDTPGFFRSSRLIDDEEDEPNIMVPWRLKERMKTVSVALVACLNIRVDPPDVVKPSPCARMECWMDPYSMTPAKALEQVGKNLEQQYQRWQPRAKFKQSLDPTVEEVKKLCDSLRRSAKDERVLFHYNGHGVPRPTANSEIWVFNKNFTQYIPLSLYDLQTWLGSPSIYVFDCSSAGVLINNQQNQEDHIIFAACSAGELLPQNPDLPADIFTSCLTTPIRMALRWFCTRSSPLLQMDPEMAEKVPGRLNERKTVLGELNWIFTAITDTIAWNILPPDLFQRLFRQDLLVASIFRNFILAERLLRSVNCTPVSVPRLPPSYQHPLWAAWDLAVDVCLSQLPELLANPNAEYRHSTFFTEQLTAFEVWLEFGSSSKSKPLELPIVLQVLLSQVHRLRALVLLARFLDMGSWAVNHALSVGIFPYVLKLLQSPAVELKQALVFIWCKILTVDKTCQLDLVRDAGHVYFLNVLTSDVPDNLQALSLAVLSVIVSDFAEGKEKCMDKGLIDVLKAKIEHGCPHIRKWVCLCAGKLWSNSESSKMAAMDEKLPQAVGLRLAGK